MIKFIRSISTKSKSLNSEINELNNLYNDFFIDEVKEIDEIEELNNELSEFFGSDVPLDKIEIKPAVRQETKQLSLLDKLKSPSPYIIKSTSNNPFFNLALEDKIFELNSKSINRLIFYINSPCVVIGKNQNPFKETSLPLLSNLGIPILRRFSGGGTVVHDLGNLNYCFMTSREDFKRGEFNGKIVDSINKALDKNLKVNERGDIVMSQDIDYKVSGSAYKISKGKAYHHGTMLLNSNLKMLKALLAKNDKITNLKDSSVDSVSSKVKNTEINSNEFIKIVSDAFKTNFHVETLEIDENDSKELQLEETIEKLKSWNWTIGSTPNFELSFNYQNDEIRFVIKKGCLKELVIPESLTSDFEILQLALESGEDIYFKGDIISGFIMNNDLSSFLAKNIDGTEI